MEDIKQRLKFDDFTVRTRLVQKLVQTIKNKTNKEIITASSKQIPELTLLWESLSESPKTSNFVIQGIVHLVSNKYIEVQYALNKLLGSFSTSSNVSVIVKGISKIVIYHHKQNRSNNRITYSLHHPKHPFISVLDHNKDFLPLILENIADAINDENIEGFQAMEPIISYLLYNPTPKCNYSKVLILEMLIDSIDNEPKIAFCVLRCIPHLQIETSEQVSEASLLIMKTKKVFDSMECSENERFFIAELFLLSSIALSERCFNLGQDPSRLLKIAIQISSSLNKDKCSSYVNMCLVLIAITLKSATGVHIEKILSIAMMLLEFNQLSQTVLSFLAFSVIQIFPEPSITIFSEVEKSCASQLLEKLKQHFLISNKEYTSQTQNEENPKNDENNCNTYLFESFSFSVQSSSCCAQFAQQLDSLNWPSKQDWLKSLKKHVNLCDKQENLDVVFSVVTALFISCPDDPELLSSCLDTVEAILQKNDFLSTRLFSTLLYKLNILKTPESKFVVFAFLPKSAAHKYAIPPVINMLTQMSKEPELKAVTIHLMFQLWKKHNRVFSFFHNMLLDSNKTMSKDANFNEILITKAATIKEICLVEPEHGSDFLSILSKIFNESNDEDSSPAACLALEGVINLCKAEIIDLRSTWKLLGPKLSKDKRVSVTCQMYKLLSLIPDLNVKSPEFDAFMKEIVAKIWKQISSNSLVPETEKEAYKTLAKFPFDCCELKLLPSAAKINLELPASMKATPFEMGKSPEDVLTYIPGYCFVDLMKSIHNETVLSGYSELLSSIIDQEVSAFPRSVYSKRKQYQKRQTTNEALLKVPQILCSQIEARKSPALQKNIAAGLLLCYEPPLEYGKDGEPIKRSVVCQYKFYEQVLSVLLNEVNVDTTEWQRAILLPEAWGSFMERAFFTYDEARKTELELQRNLGQLDVSPEEFNCRCKTTWLWVRDRILNLIKTSVKNAPTSHANAIFAVSGLVHAVNKFHSSLDDESKTLSDDAENFTKHEVFVAECTETILCAMQPDYQNKGKVHSWLLTHLSRPNSSSGYLVKGCSCAALCHLTSVVISNHSNDIPNFIQYLLQNLSHSSPVLNFYSGLGLGMFVKALCDIGYADIGETQELLLLHAAKSLFNLHSSLESFSSSVFISLTITMSALSSKTNEIYKDWVSTTCNIFYEELLKEDVSSMSFEALSICVSAMMISAADGSCMNVNNVEELASWFENHQDELPQCSGTSVALGMLIESLERFGCSYGKNLKEKLQKEWLNTLSSEKKPTLHRLAALNGLCSLYSCGRGLFYVKSKSNIANNMINDVVLLMFQLLTATRDTGLQNVCSWEVGRLFSVQASNQESEEQVPSSYHYLNEKNVLKFVVKAIVENHTSDEYVLEQCHQITCLKALNKEFCKPLPPLNWISVLGPYLENKDSCLSDTALSILIFQAKSSPHAANILASYCCPPLIHTIPEEAWKILLTNIPNLSSSLPPPKLQMFFQTIISFVIKSEEQFKKSGDIVKQGILNALKQSHLKQQSMKMVEEAFIAIFKIFKKDISQIQLNIKWVCLGLLQLSDKRLETLLNVSKNNADIAILTLIWCFFVKTGKKPLSCLKLCIEEGKHAATKDKELICSFLCDCFRTGIHNKESNLSKSENCISWLIETIGWINVLNEPKPKIQLLTIGEIFLFLNDVCLATIIGCSGLECSYNLISTSSLTHQQMLENLPLSISKLGQNEKWLSVMDKVIDWLMLLLTSEHLETSDKHFIKLSLNSVRNLAAFQKGDVWTNVINVIR